MIIIVRSLYLSMSENNEALIKEIHPFGSQMKFTKRVYFCSYSLGALIL